MVAISPFPLRVPDRPRVDDAFATLREAIHTRDLHIRLLEAELAEIKATVLRLESALDHALNPRPTEGETL